MKNLLIQDIGQKIFEIIYIIMISIFVAIIIATKSGVSSNHSLQLCVY